jgi:hypothetical protein
VSAVRFCSTHIKTLLASLVGGPPVVTAGLMTVAGTASGRGHRLVLEKFFVCVGPTSAHNRYIIVRYFDTHKNDIYKKENKT